MNPMSTFDLRNEMDELTRREKALFRANFNFEKKALIDYVFDLCKNRPQSFADLGGVWAVDGAYTFYALERYSQTSAVLVDTDFTDATIQRARAFPMLRTIVGNFGNVSVMRSIGPVDSIFMFDVLLHQVSPDWDEILTMYSSISPCFLIYNPQFVASEKSVRLLDLGEEGYFANVPRDRSHPIYSGLFERMYEIHPQHNRMWRDIHSVWQWGITDEDLWRKMKDLGYIMQYYKNCGQWAGEDKNDKILKNFENHAFVFVRPV
jgi:hypothetical protein